MSEKHNLIVVPGVEISARVGHRAPHILGLGIDPKLVHSRLPVLRDPLTVIKWIHDNGGIAIAPHPKQVQTLTALSYSELQSILEEQNRFDGIEVATLQGYNETVARIADKYKVSAVGSSDFHMLAQVGVVVTDVFTDTSSWQEVIKAIQERRCVPLTTARIGSAPRKRTPGILLQQFMGRQL